MRRHVSGAVLLFGFFFMSGIALAQSDSAVVQISLHGNYDGMRLSRGVRTEEDITRTLRGQEKFLLACLKTAYSALGKDAPKGILQLRFLIQPDGYASDVQIIRTPIAIQSIQDCIQQIFSRARFKNVRESSDQQLTIDYTIE